MKEIDIFRNGVKVCTLPITENNASYTKRLMAEENIVIEYSTTDIMPIKPLDYILYKGVKYTLWTTPIPKIGDGDVADYSLVFFAPYYILYHKKFKHIGADSNLTDAFSYSGYTSDFAQLIINTINDIDAGWSIGEIENLGFKTIEFNDNSCYTALSKICEAYECEFDFNNKILTIKKSIGNQTDHTFSYGKGKGLYELTVQELSNSSIITKLEVFGGTTNMNKGTRLKLAAPLEKNIDRYGIREDKVIFEHIFPRLKEKTITGVTVPSDIANAKKWEINLDITFDLSKCVIAGLTPQLQFQSGELKGITFDLASISENNTDIDWNNTTKRCYIITKTDGTYKSPSATRQPKVGDKFVLLNISMDQSYINDALAELDVEGRKYHDTVCVPQLAYSLNIDPRYIKTHSTSINIGDKITVLDSKRSVNDKVRVTIKKYPLRNPNNLDLTISSEVLYESSEKVQVQIDKNSQITAIHDDDIRRQYMELKRIDKEAERIKDSLGPVLSRLSYDEKNNTLVSSVAFASAESVVMFGTEGSTEGGSGGVMEHNQLFNRDFADQHPISSITGLTATLDSKASTSHTHSYLSAITKDMVEQVLTGDIASHTHSEYNITKNTVEQVLTGDITSHTHNKYALLNGSETEDFNVKTLTASGVGYFKSGLVLFGTEGGAGGGGSGTLYHDQLENRNIANQHTISAITDLQTMLDNRVLNSDARLSNARPANGGIAAFTSIDNDIVFGRNTLQFAQTPVSGTGLNEEGVSSPDDNWHSHIIMNHGNDVGFYQQLSIAFYSDNLYLRRIEHGTPRNWRRIALSGESQPASDVYAWAKAANKPIYSIDELLKGDTVTRYLGNLSTDATNNAYRENGGWAEWLAGASIGYYSLYSGGSASSILLKHAYGSNDIYFKKSIDSNRWLSDWNFFWTSANIQFTNEPIPNYGVKYDQYGYVNAIIFHDTYIREDAIPINSIYVRNGSDTFLRNTSTANFISKLGLWTNTNFTPHFKIDGGSYDTSTDWNSGFSNRGYMGSVFSGANKPTEANWNFLIQAVHRNGESDGPNYVFQLGCGMTSHRHVLCFRGGKTESWNAIWSTANLNRPIHTDDSRGLNNITNVSNRIWFDYNFGGIGQAGSVLSFSGLGGGYEVEIGSSFMASRLFFRTKDGDRGIYNPIYEIYNSGSTKITVPNNGRGDLGIYTEYNSLPGYNTTYPTLKTSGAALYFSVSNQYTFSISYENNSTVLNHGVNNKFYLNGNVATKGTVVMFSTN